MPTVTIEGQADTHSHKGYLNYDEATAIRNGLPAKQRMGHSSDEDGV
ncbi:hypothetical protein [Neisseria wadsworthii]|nr:hypothetical protein [Neisseria wadsworthii]